MKLRSRSKSMCTLAPHNAIIYLFHLHTAEKRTQRARAMVATECNSGTNCSYPHVSAPHTHTHMLGRGKPQHRATMHLVNLLWMIFRCAVKLRRTYDNNVQVYTDHRGFVAWHMARKSPFTGWYILTANKGAVKRVLDFYSISSAAVELFLTCFSQCHS